MDSNFYFKYFVLSKLYKLLFRDHFMSDDMMLDIAVIKIDTEKWNIHVHVWKSYCKASFYCCEFM